MQITKSHRWEICRLNVDVVRNYINHPKVALRFHVKYGSSYTVSKLDYDQQNSMLHIQCTNGRIYHRNVNNNYILHNANSESDYFHLAYRTMLGSYKTEGDPSQKLTKQIDELYTRKRNSFNCKYDDGGYIVKCNASGSTDYLTFKFYVYMDEAESEKDRGYFACVAIVTNPKMYNNLSIYNKKDYDVESPLRWFFANLPTTMKVFNYFSLYHTIHSQKCTVTSTCD